MERLRLLANVIIIALLSATMVQTTYLSNKVDRMQIEQQQQFPVINDHLERIDSNINKINEVHPSLKSGRKWGANVCKRGTFLGFLLTEPVDTSVTNALKTALINYSGPAAKINSLKRHYNRHSEHFHGKAVDLAWDDEVIEYLLSAEGRQWLCDHGLCFYIEGKPGSKRVAKYHSRDEARKYVFYNPKASGDHVHLNLQS